MSPAESSHDRPAFTAARGRRVNLRDSAAAVETAAASASADPGWRPVLATELDDLRRALLEHIEEVEAPGGILPRVLFETPRLANEITAIIDEHQPLVTSLDACIEALVRDSEPARVRKLIGAHLTALSEHRQRGADLVWEAYAVDIGGG